MTITAAIVLFSVVWFLVFFCVLPAQFRSQADAGQVTPGTPASAPADAMVGKKAKITSGIAVVVFAALYVIITSGMITIENMDVFHVLN